MKPTIYDVANKAGVSISTVSKVLNNTGHVRKETREKVWHAIEQLNYQTNRIAAALAGKGTNTIGVLVPNIPTPFFAELIQTLEKCAREINYTLIICSSGQNQEQEKLQLELLLMKQVDGIIIAAEPHDWKLFQRLHDQNFPLILLTVDYPWIFEDIIATDDIRGGYLAGSYLIKMGHTRLAIILEKDLLSGRNRLEGFEQAIENANLELAPEYIVSTLPVLDEIRTASRKLLTMEQKPTAVFTTTDFIASIFISEALKLNISVPDDISVIGYDNTINAQLIYPNLTIVSQPFDELAEQAITKIYESITQPKQQSIRMLLTPKLIERDSVRRIKN